MRHIAERLQALGEPTRAMIIRLLMERELCVCEIVRALDEPQYKISRHLSVLKKTGLVRDWREGTWMHYEISPALEAEWLEALRGLRGVLDNNKDVQAALWRLQNKSTRAAGDPAVACCET